MRPTDNWAIYIAESWDVLGPFPIHAREQHFLSPSFPLDRAYLTHIRHRTSSDVFRAVTERVDLDGSYPSSLADGGSVRWSKALSSPDGNLEVSFPNIRWASLWATEGWAALQHHAVLRTTLTVLPPHFDSEQQPPDVPNLLVELKRGSFFTVVPADAEWEQGHGFVPEWYSGNIYEVDGAPSHLVTLPTVPSAQSTTVYYLYVSGDYEIRLFGDPKGAGSETPTLSVSVNVRFESPSMALRRETSHDVTPDFVEGIAFGDALGVGLRCPSTRWWSVTALSPSPQLRGAGIELSLLADVRFAPGQTRVLPIRISQTKAFDGDALSFDVHVTSGGSSGTVPVRVPISQLGHWAETSVVAIKATYFSVDTAPIGFIVLPPTDSNASLKAPNPPILALHGAGVDIFRQSAWVEALPRQQRSWFILPSGRTPWGLDWRGLSADDVWGTVSALTSILESFSKWRAWAIRPEKVVILGHSNGGQGTWYNAARHPDRVLAMLPAAGFIKAQAYVPLTRSRSAHFIDPFLRAILECSFVPDDNDLFLTNLVDTPALVIHGGVDMNVPTWHSRELVSVLTTWAPDADVRLCEEPGQGHWYPSVFRNAHVKAFLDSVLSEERRPPRRSPTFTLTSAVPAETGSLHGWRILKLLVPGRLARLTVEMSDGIVSVVTCNVRCFSVDATQLEVRRLDINGCVLPIPNGAAGDPQLYFQHDSGGRWKVFTAAESDSPRAAQRSTNPYSILRSPGRLKIVVSPGGLDDDCAMSVARRLANDLFTYFKLDADIVHEAEIGEAQGDARAGTGNVVVVGSPSGQYIRRCLAKGRTAFTVAEMESGPPVLQLNGETLSGLSQGIMFTHPHESSPSATMLFMIAHDRSGLERVARLFPVRTGMALADWLVIGKRADKQGASGIEKAGLWGYFWEYHSGMSWQH